MNHSVEYNGHRIEPLTRLSKDPQGWTLEVRITSADPDARGRRCHAPNTYSSQDVAVKQCLAFGRDIVDGKLKPKASSDR
jgi:hypothetical protein